MVIEYQKNTSKVTIDVREFINETNNCILSDKEAAKWLRNFRSELFVEMIGETQKRLNELESST